MVVNTRGRTLIMPTLLLATILVLMPVLAQTTCVEDEDERYGNFSWSIYIFTSLYSPNSVMGKPGWLREGVYAKYVFVRAYVLEGRNNSAFVLRDLGKGYYMWKVLRIEGDLAILNVTLKTENVTRSIKVILNIKTMDLIGEDGKAWGKAWFWIDIARLPPSPPTIKEVRNITVIRDWLGEELKNPTVSRIYSITKEANLKPVKTGLGSVDMIVTLNVRTKRIEITYILKRIGRMGKMEVVTSRHYAPGGLGFSWDYDAKSGLLLSGYYIDDILTQVFNIVRFEDMSEMGEGGYWMYLQDTNVEIGLMKVRFDPIMVIRENFVIILLGILVLIFILAFIRGRTR